MRRSSPGNEFSAPSIALNAFKAAATSAMWEEARKWRRFASTLAGRSQGDLFRTCAARTTLWPDRPNAATSSRTCTDAPLRPSTGTPRSGHKYRIFMAFASGSPRGGATTTPSPQLDGGAKEHCVKMPLTRELVDCRLHSPRRLCGVRQGVEPIQRGIAPAGSQQFIMRPTLHASAAFDVN